MADRSWDDAGGMEGVVATLDRLGAAAVGDPVGAADVGRIRVRVRRRRVRRRGLGALAVLLPVLVTLLVWRTTDADQSSQRVTSEPSAPYPATAPAVRDEPLEVSSTPMAASPLSARRAPASAWTGTELVIWGGEATGEQLAVDELGDGAAYDPSTDTWRTIAPSPLGARRRASATWTGTEVIVWGGEADGRWNSLTTGAAYDPVEDSWRSIAPAPGRSGRIYPSTAWAEGRLVVGGGMSQTPPESDVLVYDLAADTWRKVELPGVEVVQVATIGDRVAIVGLMPSEGPAPDGDRVLLRWLEPATGRVENGPDLAIAGEPTAVAAHGADGALTVAVRVSVPVPGPGGVSEGAPGVVATIEPGSSRYRRRALPDTSELPGRLGLGSRAPHLWEWTGQAVVAFELGSVALFDPESGIARVDRPRPGEAGASIPTGFDAAQVWTGSEVLIWGGSSGGGAEAELATGARLRPSP